MTSKDKKIRFMSYIVLVIATIFGLGFALYVTLSGDFPMMETQNGKIGVLLFIVLVLVNFAQGTIKIIEVFKQE